MSLECNDVSLEIGSKQLLSLVSADVRSGSLTVLIGPNGAGKSTLLRVLAGELAPSNGEVLINTQKIRDLKLRDLANIRSVMTQGSEIVFDFTVKEVVLFGWLNQREICWDIFDAVVGSSAIQGLLPRRFNTLSGGEQQRVQFARALLQLHSSSDELTGKYMLLDEPTSNLDIAHGLHMLSLLKQVVSHGVGATVVLHDLNLAARFADTVMLLHHGKVVRSGSVEHVFNEDIFTDVYGTKIYVERHDSLNRLVVHS